MRIEEDIRKIFPYYKDKAKSTERTTGTLLYKKIMYTREAVIEAQTSSTTEWYSVLSFFFFWRQHELLSSVDYISGEYRLEAFQRQLQEILRAILVLEFLLLCSFPVHKSYLAC